MQVTKSAGPETATLVDLGDATSQTARPATAVNGQATEPPKLGEEDFDMFAQSRQSFEENLPRAKCVVLHCL